ncbi:MAG: lipocalin family protein [Burkholderiales bacterium]
MKANDHFLRPDLRPERRAVLRPLSGVACAIALASVLYGCATEKANPPLPTVPSVDLKSYMGDWYEIARLPNDFQKQCVADTQAHYELAGDKVKVVNRCRTGSGEIDQAKGVAHAVEGSGNAKLRVSFFRPFYGDYWILAFGPDRQWVLVGEPGRENSWVLSRSPTLPEAQLDAALDRAAALGFDRGAFMRTPQTRPLQ